MPKKPDVFFVSSTMKRNEFKQNEKPSGISSLAISSMFLSCSQIKVGQENWILYVQLSFVYNNGRLWRVRL